MVPSKVRRVEPLPPEMALGALNGYANYSPGGAGWGGVGGLGLENRGRKENKKASAVITGRFSRVNPQIRTWVSSRFPADLRALIMGSIGRAGRALKAKPCRKGGKERKEERKKGRKEERRGRERKAEEREAERDATKETSPGFFLSLSFSLLSPLSSQLHPRPPPPPPPPPPTHMDTQTQSHWLLFYCAQFD